MLKLARKFRDSFHINWSCNEYSDWGFESFPSYPIPNIRIHIFYGISTSWSKFLLDLGSDSNLSTWISNIFLDLDSFIILLIDSFHLYHTVQMLDLSLMFDCNGCLLSTQFPLCSGVTSSGCCREKWSASCIQMSSAEVTRQIPRTAASSSAPQLGHQYCDKTSLKRLRLRNLPDQFAFWVLLRASGSFWILTELFKWLVLSHFQDIAY